MNHAEAYERAYDRIVGLVDETTQDVDVPTCPGWTVKDVVAHLASFFAEYGSPGEHGPFSEGWAERHIDQRRDSSLQECFSEWQKNIDNPGDLFDSSLGAIAVSDVLAHEQDIRTALDRPGARDDENIPLAIDRAVGFLEMKAEKAGLPAVRLVADGVVRQIGEGEPVATLRTSTFELFRTLHGRRTTEQLQAMDWTGDPGPWESEIFLFGPTEHLVET